MPELNHPVRPAIPQYPSTSTDASTVRFALPAEEFALANLFEHVPDARVELTPTIATPDDHIFLAIQTDEQESAIDAALWSAPAVTAVEQFGERADGWTYRVTWEGCPRQLIRRLTAEDVTLLSARGRKSQWELRLLAPDREGISSARDIMNDLDCGIDCRSITTCGGESSNRFELTDEQRETLVMAFEKGHYNIPRDIAADELADELGISHQALSERFRRAYETLVDSALIIDDNRET